MSIALLAAAGSIIVWVIGAIVLVVIAAILALAYIGSAHARALRRMAAARGLAYKCEETSAHERHILRGESDGHPFTLTESTEPVLEGAASQGEFESQVALETQGPRGTDLMVYPRDSTAIPLKSVPIASDIEVPDPEFTTIYLTIGENHEMADAILTPEMRAAMMAFPADSPRAHWVFGAGKTRIYWRRRLCEQDLADALALLPRLRTLLHVACQTEWEDHDD